jgi:molybdate transport system regulatory protein
MARLTVRIDIEERAAFGPGKARLLELIEETGSIRSAATAMDMSYRRAWLLVHEMQEIMNAPVVAGRTGGANGGGASLTKTGKAVLAYYRTIEVRATRAAVAQLRALSNLAKGEKKLPVSSRSREASGRARSFKRRKQ